LNYTRDRGVIRQFTTDGGPESRSGEAGSISVL